YTANAQDYVGAERDKLRGVTAKAVYIATDLTAFDLEIAPAFPPQLLKGFLEYCKPDLCLRIVPPKDVIVSRTCASGSSLPRMFRIPMRRTRSPCCALAATGHTTAAPHNAMKSRRLIKTPEAQTRNGSNLHTYSGRGTTLRMSALGHKQAYATQKPMSKAVSGHWGFQ